MSSQAPAIPECITRDRLTSPYWPNLSVAGLVSVVVLGVVFLFTSFNRLNHTDLWGHVNFGRWIAEHQALPATDPFAAAPSEIPALHGAWLSQALGYEIQAAFGNEVLVLGHAILMTLTAAVLMLALYRRGTPALWAALAGLVFLLLDLPIAGTIRPQLFGQLGIALFLLGIAVLPQRRDPLLWLPAVAAVWANLHGSILMGIAVLGIHMLSAAHDAIRRTGSVAQTLKDHSLQRAIMALGLVLAVGCLNPHGPALYLRIAGFSDHPALAAISEWRALSLYSLTGVLVAVSLIATAVAWKYSQRPWQASDVLLLLVFGVALFPAIRMLAWWALVWPFVVWPHLASAWHVVWEPAEKQHFDMEADQPTAMRTLMAVGFVFMAFIVAPPTFSLLSGRTRGEGAILVTDTPIYVTDEILRRGLTGTIAAPLDWADFLLWKTDGALKPLVHGHVHLSSPAAWRAQETIFRAGDGWLATLRNQKLQYVLVPRRRYPALAKQVLTADRSGKGELRIIYQDQRCLMAEIKS